MNVDEAIRELRRSLPGTPDGLADRIVASVTGATDAPAQRRRRVSSKGVLVAASVVAAAAVLLTVAMLIRNGTRPNPEPATPVTPPARVDWGQIVTIRLRPDEGISIAEMRERFTTALAFRTYDYGGAGVEVLSAKGDEMTVRLPGSAGVTLPPDLGFGPFLTFGRLVILDDEAGVLASGPDLTALEEVARDLISSGTKVAYYLQARQPTGEWTRPERRETRAAAEKWRAANAGAEILMLAVPVDATVTQGDDDTVRLIRPVQAVPSSSVRSIRREGDIAIVAIDPLSESLKGRPVSAYYDFEGEGRYREGLTFIGSGVVDEAGRVRLPVGRFWSASVARPDLGGRIERVGAREYGTKPVERREEYPAPPAWNRQMGGPPDGTRWVLLARGAFGGDDYVLVGAELRRMLIGLRVHNLTERYDVSMSIPTKGRRGSVDTSQQADACSFGVATPSVVGCGGSGGGDGAKDGRSEIQYTTYGRVGPGVARITVRLGGVEQDAVINGSWWFAHVRAVVQVGEDPSGLRSTEAISDASVSAWDADGNPVPVSPPNAMRE